MTETRRPSRRQEYARITRDAVILAAQRRFVEHGYAATSIRAVAADANVSEQTVYRVFGDKAELLRAVLLAAVGVDPEAQSLREGSLPAIVGEPGSPRDRLRVAAQAINAAYERGLAQLETAVLSAAGADARVAVLAREITVQRYEDTRSLVLAILGNARLEGLEIDEVVDYVYAVESSPVYLALTAERGWSTDQYVEWFVDLFERVILSRIVDGPEERPAT